MMQVRLQRFWRAVTKGYAGEGMKEHSELASSSPQKETEPSTGLDNDALKRYQILRDRRYVERVLRALDEENDLNQIEGDAKEKP